MLNLVRKELAEHWWVLLLVLPLALSGFLLSLAAGALQDSGSPLESIHYFGVSIFLVLEMVICNRLVVQEYSHKTQLFLEALPISRTAMLLTKYFVGMVTVGATMAACFALALLAASRGDDLDTRFVLLMATRLAVYVFCTFSFFFMMGLLGRYRIAIYLALLLAWMILGQQTDFEMQTHTPFGLLSDRFAFERLVYPVRLLSISAIAGVLFVAVTLLMGLTREGSVAALMAERMSHREKMFIAAILLSAMMTGTVLDEKKRPEPYSINHAIKRTTGQASVQVEIAGEEARAEELADRFHGELNAIANYLQLESAPEMFIVNRRDLDADRFEAARLENADGALIRVNYTSAEWSLDEFRPFMIDVWLSRATHYKAIHEPRCWVLEGFSEYWPRLMRDPVKEDDFTRESPAWNAALAIDLRAAYGASFGVAAIDVDQWYQLRERLGQPIVRSIACSGLVFAEREFGKAKLQAFLHAMLGGAHSPDGFTDLDLWMRPIDVVWKETMGSDYRAFQQAWLAELQRLAQDWKLHLNPIPRLSASGRFVAKSGVSYALEVSVEATSLESSDAITLRYQTISAFDQWEDDLEARSLIRNYDPNQPLVVDRLFARGERLRWTASTRAARLRCDVISSWQRTEVK